MAYDLLRGPTSGNWSREGLRPEGLRPATRSSNVGTLPVEARGYTPEHWISETEAEAMVQNNQKHGGTFGLSLPREDAERKTLAYLRANLTGIKSSASGSKIGSWLLPEKQQKAILNKIDDVRFDLRAVGRHVGMGAGLLAASLGLLGLASIFRTSTLGQQSQSTPKRYYGQVGNNRQGNLR
jgi:hypothetical protein